MKYNVRRAGRKFRLGKPGTPRKCDLPESEPDVLYFVPTHCPIEFSALSRCCSPTSSMRFQTPLRDNNSATISSDLWSACAVSFFQVAAVASFRPNASLNPWPTRNRNRAISWYISRSFVVKVCPSLNWLTAAFRHQLLGSSPAAVAAFSTWPYSSSVRRKVIFLLFLVSLVSFIFDPLYL